MARNLAADVDQVRVLDKRKLGEPVDSLAGLPIMDRICEHLRYLLDLEQG